MGAVAASIRHPTLRGDGVESEERCSICAVQFIGTREGQVTCAERECRLAHQRASWRARRTDPEFVRRERARNRAYDVAHRRSMNAKPWLLGQPPHGVYLPGGGCELYVDPLPKWPVAHRNIRALHGAMSAILGEATGEAHDPGGEGRSRWPNFSLVPWPRGSLGWGVYWRTAPGAALAGHTFQGVLFDRPTTFRFGPLVRVRSPKIARRGHQRIIVDAVTPVCVTTMGRTVWHLRPTTTILHSALTNTLPGRVGLPLDFDPSTACLDVITDATRVERVEVGSKFGVAKGWVGQVVVEVNAVARWLIEAAARGPGLGSRTGFGFGRIRVSECP